MAAQLPVTSLSYKIAVLVFLENSAGELLLILRNKAPNLGSWSPIGGKLEMGLGESPFECAARETLEETGHAISTADLHLFCMIAEKAYEGAGHWLMFLFRCRKPIDTLPPTIDEGRLGYRPASLEEDGRRASMRNQAFDLVAAAKRKSAAAGAPRPAAH